MQKYDFTGVKDIKSEMKKHKSDYDNIKAEYTDPGTQYAYDVIFSDKYLTNRDVQLACARHLNDLLRIGQKDFPYTYSLDMVSAIEYFCRLLVNPDNTRKTIVPFKWQSFILDSLIGWRRIENNGTRFTTANISIARRQGKTYIGSVLVNFYYFVVCQGATSQDFLVASYDRDHAKKLFNDISLQAKALIETDDFKDWSKENEIEPQATQVVSHKTMNIIRQGTSEGSGFDSYHNVIAVYDEIGNLKPAKNETLRQITSGQNGINNKMFVKISTAYPDIKVKFKNDQDVTRALIEKDYERDADDVFQAVYAQDSEEEVFSPELWGKSNPNLQEMEVQVKDTWEESLQKDMATNEREGTLETFVNKSLNLWSARFHNSFVSLDNINRNIIDDFDIKGRDVYVGFDSSQTNDNTAYGFIFPYKDNGKDMFYIGEHSFIPFAQAKKLEAKSKQDGLDYAELEKRGFCSITNLASGVINKEQVYQWLVEYVAKNNLKVKSVIADPNLAKWFTQMIENYQPKWELLTLPPTSYQLSNPTKDFQNKFVNGNITMLNDPLLIDGLNNAVLKEDNGGAVKVDRQNRTSDHIDTTDALINAHSQAQNYFKDYHGDDYNFMNDLNHEQRKKAWASMFGAGR